MKNTAIKVVKKVDRERAGEKKAIQPKQRDRQVARARISTITGWVRDIQDRHRNESRRAFESLFRDPLPEGSK